MIYMSVCVSRHLKEELAWATHKWLWGISNIMLNSYSTKELMNNAIIFKIKTYCHISLINIPLLISTPVQYYLNANNIDTVVIFISSAPSNSIACNFATPGITANYHVIISSYSSCNKQVERKYNFSILNT